jgi:hypothetical protein
MEVPDEVIRELREYLGWITSRVPCPRPHDPCRLLAMIPEPPPALLPCPFCGGQPEILMGYLFVHCPNPDCATDGPSGDDERDAIRLWNTRKESK